LSAPALNDTASASKVAPAIRSALRTSRRLRPRYFFRPPRSASAFS
jgi:hypothetical protein